MKKIPVLVVRFKNDISFAEIPLFRGAVISKVPSSLTLFHNHIDEGLRYHYPLIQYKRVSGKAVIVCVGEGTEEIGDFFASSDFDLQIGKRQEKFVLENVIADKWLLQTWENTFSYTVRKWLPFNSDNYTAYRQMKGVVERTQLLERIFTGNILSMCSGLGLHLEQPVRCKLTEILDGQICCFKGVKMQALDVSLMTNVSLHDYISIGKAASHGFGMVKTINKNQ